MAYTGLAKIANIPPIRPCRVDERLSTRSPIRWGNVVNRTRQAKFIAVRAAENAPSRRKSSANVVVILDGQILETRLVGLPDPADHELSARGIIQLRQLPAVVKRLVLLTGQSHRLR